MSDELTEKQQWFAEVLHEIGAIKFGKFELSHDD